MKTDAAIKKAKRFITPALVFHTGITARKARGIFVYDESGRRYMDFSSGLAVANLGHCHPAVVKAAKAQTGRLIHSGCIFHYESEAELAEKLARITPAGIDMFFFSNSGAEAVEGAIKLARYATGRQGIIAFTGGFHGRTFGALSLTSSAARYRKLYHPLLPSVFHAPYPYCYRCPMGKTRSTCSTDCFEYLRKKILRHLITPDEVACVVIEPVLGEGGYFVPPADYMEKLRGLCTKEGILLVADEVQTGFGRTGRWFACEHFSIRPDIIVMAKGIASGFPLSAVGASRRIMSKWAPGAHGTTFGGNPVSCAAANATIDTIEKKNVLKNAREVGAYAFSRLKEMQERCPSIGDVRGLGLMIGVELVKKEKQILRGVYTERSECAQNDSSPDRELLDRVMKRCLAKGLIIVECGVDKNVARFMPPLVTTKAQMEAALGIFEEALLG